VPDCASGSGTYLPVASHLPSYTTNDGALDAAFGLYRADIGEQAESEAGGKCKSGLHGVVLRLL